MLTGSVIVLASFVYVGLLFAIAYYGDKRADAGRSIIANPYIYALSLAVYCTSWTFYGSVGRAATSGIGFLPIYLGPTLMAVLWWYVMLKMIRISKANRITSIADFIASRYGKSQLLGGLATIIAVIGIVPYISLQLKAVSNSFSIILKYPAIATPESQAAIPLLADNTFYIALLLAAFTILFGTRHLDASERHEGLVAAIAFESLVKLLAFIAVGVFATFVLYDGFDDIFARATEYSQIAKLLDFNGSSVNYTSWASLTFVSMLAIMFLPRQFQIAVVENVDERHLNKAVWLFPLYLLAINIFVLPITFAGLMNFPAGNVDADTFVLTLPIAQQQPVLTLVVFIGGPVGRDRHGDRRDHRAFNHGMQQPRDAAAAAAQRAASARSRRPVVVDHRHPARRNRRRTDAGLCLFPPRGRSLRAGIDRADFVCGGGAVCASYPGRHVLEKRNAPGRDLRSVRRLPGMGLHAAAAVVCEIGMASARLYRSRPIRHRTPQSRSSCSASTASTTSRTAYFGACFSISAPMSACRW